MDNEKKQETTKKPSATQSKSTTQTKAATKTKSGKRVKEKEKTGLLSSLLSNKHLKIGIPAAVVVVAVVVLLIISPWQQNETTDDDDEINAKPIVIATITPLPTATPTPEPTPEPTPTPIPHNPLTGVTVNAAGEPWTEEMSKNRPFAVALGNTDIGYSLRGVGDADIICEYMNYSHGVTRIMAIYQEVEHVPGIRGIRSFRTWSYEIARGFDAIFVTWGGLAYVDYHNSVPIRGNPIDKNYGSYDASSVGIRMDTDIFPPASNGIANQNAGAITGEKLVNSLPEDFRSQHKDDYSQGFTFVEDGTPVNGETAEKFTVSFATFSSKKTEFIYNANEGVYNMRQFGRDFTDYANNSVKIGFENVLVLQMSMNPRINNPQLAHVYIDTVDKSSPAYYFNGGKWTEITWGRDDVDTPFKLYNLDGTPLEMGIGKTFICVVELKEDFEPIKFE